MTLFRSPRALRRGVLLLSAVAAAGVASCMGDVSGPESDSSPVATEKQGLSGAANSGLFELDRNAVAGAAAGDDWETLFNGGGSATAVVSPMPISDKGLGSGTALLDHIFKSSSDVNEISTWNWVVADANKPGALPPKDNTTNAYAAAYLGGGEMFVYFGQDRFTANGTSDIGFWFLKNEVALVPAGCSLNTVGCTGSFSGTHAVGDVLVLSAFTNGGQVDTIEVYEWVGSGGNAGGGVLQLKHSGTNADCSGAAGSTAAACAIVNLQNETSPWTYLAGETGSVSGVFPPRHFFEGGVNLSTLGLSGCFSTFLSETRSSSSLTAQLKDFALGAFEVCDIAVTKSGPALSKIGDSVVYSYTITNPGAIALQLRSVVDDKVGNLESQAIAAGCGVLAPGASCTFEMPFVIPDGASDPFVNTITVVYAENATVTKTFTAKASFSVNLFQPSVTIAKSGDTLSKVGDPVNYQITLNNTSSADTPDLVCTVSDPLLGLNTPVTLASGSSKTITASYTVKSGDPDPLVNTVTATCSPMGFPNVLTESASHSVNLFQPSIALTKTGPAFSKAGDSADYVITLTNTSSADTPNLVCLITDPIAGVSKAGVILASGASDVTTASRTVQPTDPDPLVNTATASCSPLGFPNVLEKTASSSADLLHPSFTISEVCTTDPVPAGSPAQFSLVLTNTGDADLVFQISGSSVASFNGTFAVAAGQTMPLSGSVAVPGGVTQVTNTVSALITLAAKYDLPNQFTGSASASCQVNPEGCTPGSWKNPNGRLLLWDSPTDPLAVAAGFHTGTSFHAFFGLNPSTTGLSSSLTMQGAINLGGGGAEKLARHSVAALLNVAAGLNYLFPPGTNSSASLIAAIQNAYNTRTYEPLASQLDAGNNGTCPIR
jgi:hypothetical protein